MSKDYYEENKKFAENDNLFTFDYGDQERVDLNKLGLPLSEIIFIAWLRSIRKELVAKNKCIFGGIEGKHRTGKSLSAFTISYILDPTFWARAEKRIISSPQEFLQEIKIIRKEDIHGACFVIDEGGVVMPSDEWYSEWSKVLGKTFQMIGYLNIMVLWCAINRDAVGSKFRKLFDFMIQTKRDNNEFSNLNVYELEYNPMFRKYFNKHKKLIIAGQRMTMKHIEFGRPPKFIEDRYKAITTPQKDLMLEEFGERGDSLSTPKKKKETDFEGIVKDVIEKYTLYLSKRSKPNLISLDKTEIQYKYKLKSRDADYIKRHAEEELNSRITSPVEAIPSKIETVMGSRKKLVAHRMEDMVDGPVEVEQEEEEIIEEEAEEDSEEEEKEEKSKKAERVEP